MRMNDRAIREELRKQAISVPIPDDMWANISRELDKDAAKAVRRERTATVRVPVRQLLAFGAAAAVFWMVLIPSGKYVDRIKQPAAPKTIYTTTDTRWDIPTRTKVTAREPQSEPQVSVERRHPTQMIPTSK